MIKRLTLILLLAGIGSIFAGLMLDYTADEELNRTARYYADHTDQDLGAANLVTAIIVTYRGLDTLGEVTVLFLTAAIVGLVLAKGKRKHRKRLKRTLPPAGELLLTGTRLLLPLILLFGAYVFTHGHLTPGGGIEVDDFDEMAAILMLLLSNPLKRFSHRLISVVESTSGVAFVVIGAFGIVLAGGFLDNRILPIGTFGELFSAGAIPLIYTFVGLKVGAEFSSMLVSLSETEQL